MNRKNYVVLEGNICADPRTHTFTKTDKDGHNKDVTVCTFTLACDGGRTGRDEETFFAKVEAWAEAAQALSEYRKGDSLHVEAIGRNHSWKDAKTGEERREVIFRCTHFIPCYIKDSVEV